MTTSSGCERRAVRLLQRYETLRPLCAIDESFLEVVAAWAQPRAAAVLGPRAAELLVDGRLPVETTLLPVERGLYGQLMSAWPLVERRPVELYVLNNWAFFLALLREALDTTPAQRADLDQLFAGRSRILVGIGNDVLQGFVVDPPAGTYSMVRHHALMLLVATLWLAEPQRLAWLAAYRDAAARFVRSHPPETADPIIWLAPFETTAFHIFEQRGPATSDETGARRFLQDEACVDAVLDYLGAASLGIAALEAAYQQVAPAERAPWLTTLANERHAAPDFNCVEIAAYAQALSQV